MAGTYGEKTSFEDARVTVTEFLDNFYDDSTDNYNQAFCELERRLRSYFGYEPRDTENQEQQQANGRWAVCLDGTEVRRFDTERDAAEWCRLYDGDHEATYQRAGEE